MGYGKEQETYKIPWTRQGECHWMRTVSRNRKRCLTRGTECSSDVFMAPLIIIDSILSDLVDGPSQKQSNHCLMSNVSSSNNPSSLMIKYSHQSCHNLPKTCNVVCAAVVGATEHVPVAVSVIVAVARHLGFARRLWGAAVPVLNQFFPTSKYL